LHKLLDFLSHNDVDFVSQYEMKRNLLHGDMLTLSSGNTDFESISDTNARSVEKLLREYIARTERSQISKGFEQLIHSNELCCGSLSFRNRVSTCSSHDLGPISKVFSCCIMALNKEYKNEQLWNCSNCFALFNPHRRV
ncbi:hypothetical protein, partial [Vibrio parahaemolyticus]